MTKTTLALTLVAFLLGGFLAYECTAGAENGPTTLRVQSLELVDEHGVKRASLIVEEGAAMFRIFDATGTVRVKLGGGTDGSGLVLANEKTEVGVHLLATRNRTFMAVQRDAKRRVTRP
jgi:hypothetical protein